METINYILRKLEYLERENRRRESAMVCLTITTVAVGSWLLYFKNRKINNLKSRVRELEDKLRRAENTERE